MREIVIIRVYFNPSCAPAEVAPFDRFSCLMAQKTCFHVTYLLFGVRTSFFLHFPLFFAEKREIPYSRNVKLQLATTPVI